MLAQSPRNEFLIKKSTHLLSKNQIALHFLNWRVKKRIHLFRPLNDGKEFFTLWGLTARLSRWSVDQR